MKFASSYEPNQYEADIYGAWEAAGIFNPSIPTVPVDNDGDGIDDRTEGNTHATQYYSIVMPPPNANGNLHIGHGLTIALNNSSIALPYIQKMNGQVCKRQFREHGYQQAQCPESFLHAMYPPPQHVCGSPSREVTRIGVYHGFHSIAALCGILCSSANCAA